MSDKEPLKTGRKLCAHCSTEIRGINVTYEEIVCCPECGAEVPDCVWNHRPEEDRLREKLKSATEHNVRLDILMNEYKCQCSEKEAEITRLKAENDRLSTEIESMEDEPQEQKIARKHLVLALGKHGHNPHCILRIQYGDGECECGALEPHPTCESCGNWTELETHGVCCNWGYSCQRNHYCSAHTKLKEKTDA